LADFLALNQYAVPIKASSAPTIRQIAIGSQRRAFDGTLITQRRNHKRSWRLRTTAMSEANAHALLGLLAGRGHHWSFSSSADYYYSSKGLGKASGTATRTASGGKFTSYITIAAAGQVIWDTDHPDYTDSTAMVWYYTSAAWHHYIVRGDGAKWVDGVRNDAASTPFLSIDSSGRTLLGDTGAGAGQDFDDLVSLPFTISADMAEAFGVMTAAFSDLPDLTMTGDIIRGASTTVQGVGDIGGQLYQAAPDGSWAQNLYELEFELAEP
jgi:hypothetical protein